jgi:dUTPase
VCCFSIWSGVVGFDLSAAYEAVVPARGKVLIKTDLAIAIPENTYGRVGKFDTRCFVD